MGIRARLTETAQGRLAVAALAVAVGLLAVALLRVAVATGPGPTVTSQMVSSHDGTRLFTSLFLPPGAGPDAPVPLVLRSHGWGARGETQVGTGLLARLLEEGYAVLTWDHRGFGRSQGEAHLMASEVEGRDAQALLDWVVTEVPAVAREDAAGEDPVVGMTGASYGGAMQLTLASLDDRVDAIVPESSWADLRRALYENQVVNRSWSAAVYQAGRTGVDMDAGTETNAAIYAPELRRLAAEAADDPRWSEELLDYLAERSLVGFGDRRPVTVPTLVVQGTVDTLFDLSEGLAIAEHVSDQGAPVRLIQFCGGHVSCPDGYADAGDRERIDEQIVRWFDRYLKGRRVDTGPLLSYRTNEGVWRSADRYPPPAEEPFAAAGEGTLRAAGEETAGGVDRARVGRALPADAPESLRLAIGRAEAGPAELVGVPRLALTVAGDGPVHLFARLIHREAGRVVDLQETPVRLAPDGAGDASRQLALSAVAYTLPPGHHLDLELSTVSAMHVPAGTGDYTVTARVEVPRAARPEGS